MHELPLPTELALFMASAASWSQELTYCPQDLETLGISFMSGIKGGVAGQRLQAVVAIAFGTTSRGVVSSSTDIPKSRRRACAASSVVMLDVLEGSSIGRQVD